MRYSVIPRIVMACLMLGIATFNAAQVAGQNKTPSPNSVPPEGSIAATPSAEEPRTVVQPNQTPPGTPVAVPAGAGALPPGTRFQSVPVSGQRVLFQPGQAVDQPTEEMSQLHALDAQLGHQAETLVGQLAELTDERQRAETKEKLQEVLSQQFDAQQKVRELEVARVEAKLKKLRDLINKRSDARRTIIDKRLEQLVREAEGLGWSSPAGGLHYESVFVPQQGGGQQPKYYLVPQNTTPRESRR